MAAELAGIDEITVDGGGGTNTFVVSGDFAGTDLDPSTITIRGSSGNDTVDVSGRRSDHRVVFTSNGGDDKVLGSLSTRDVVELPPGSTVDAGNVHNNGDGTCTVVNGEHKLTAAASAPMFVEYAGSELPAEETPEEQASLPTISGTDGRDGLRGTSQDDHIAGLSGDDKLYGRDGADILDGGTGSDRMYGGGGDDTYIVDNRCDRVEEDKREGVDTVETTLARYTLDDNVENLTYTGSSAFTGKGNKLDNVIEGGSDNDKLTGGGGSDTFVFAAGFGNDCIYDFDADPRKGQDLLDLSELGITAETFEMLVDIDADRGDTVITIGDDSITLFGVNGRGSNVISQADFILA